MLLSARNEIKASVVLEIIRIIIANLLADRLLRHFVHVLIIAYVDSSMDQEQVDQFAMILLNDLGKESMGICVSSFLEQVFGDGVIVL